MGNRADARREGGPMEPTIVNAKPRYRPATLVEPPGFGYLLLSADVEPPTGRRPFPGHVGDEDRIVGPAQVRRR